MQLEIMNVLWERGEMTAKELTDALNENRTTAHSTVQTLLRTLEAKGVIDHRQVDRSFLFRPTIGREEVETASMRDVLRGVFRGSAYGLVAHLLKNERVSKEELTRLRELIDRHTSEEEAK